MSEDVAGKIQELLAEESTPEWKRSAEALKLAFEWSRRTLESTQNSRAGLLMALDELVQALSTGTEVFGNLDELVQKASPGPDLKTVIDSEEATLARLKSDVGGLKRDMARLDALRLEKEDLIKEQEKLEKRRKELEFFESFDPALVEQLRKQLETIEKTKPWLSKMQKLRMQLESELPKLVQLSGEALLVLQTENREHLKDGQERLDAIEKEAEQLKVGLADLNEQIKKAENEVAARHKRYEEAEHALRERQELLNEYIRVDQQIADAVNNGDAKQAKQILNDIERQLGQVDEALKTAIDLNAKAKEISQVYL